MQARAVLSLLLAFALAFAPLASRSAVLATGTSADGGVHDSNAAPAMEDHGAHAAHEGMQVDANMPASGCVDHAQCKGDCAAHCVSLPAPMTQTPVGTEPIQASQVAVLGPTFSPETPSRPPKTVL